MRRSVARFMDRFRGASGCPAPAVGEGATPLKCACSQRARGRHKSGTEVRAVMDTRRPEARNFSAPDETLTLTKGSAATVRIGELVVGRLVLEPGYRYSEHGPTAGSASCQFHHIGVGISGAARFRMDDGSEFDVRAGDVFDIPPGHDTWVLGDEPAVSFIWGGWRGWGKPSVGERILTTILMTDIAGSTDRAVALGDAAWDRLL